MDLSLEIKSLRARKMLDALLGNECADLVLRGGKIINVVTREIYPGDVAVKDEFILMMGDCSSVTGETTEIVDVTGKYLCPGLIDSHMHFESSMLTVTEFSRLSIPGGTTTLYADPHEIGNVLGTDGILAMIKEAERLPNRVLFTVPALAPDVPGLETAGCEIDSGSLDSMLSHPLVQGLGEMQGFSNAGPVYRNLQPLLDDLLVSVLKAKRFGKTVEGNAPALSGPELAAHIVLCGGKTSCHETTGKSECAEKLRNGVTVFMREGSTQKNMAECIRVVTEDGMDSRNLVLATDDMVAEDLLGGGHMDEVVRRTIRCGVDPVEAIQMATINAATHFGRGDIGVLAPGKAADICVVGDLMNMRVDLVVLGGRVAAREGKLLLDLPRYRYPDTVKKSMKCAHVRLKDLAVPSTGTSERVRAIVVIPDQNLTGCAEAVLSVRDGAVAPDPAQDILPLISIERHGKNGNIGKAFVKGMGIQSGAIAQSVAHDTHNLLVCGASLEDMVIAANRVMAMGGGIAVVQDGKVLGDLPLEVAGLMTDSLTGQEVGGRIAHLHELAKTRLKCAVHSPFMHLSFLSLSTSPKWKISDKGLMDTENYQIIPAVES